MRRSVFKQKKLSISPSPFFSSPQLHKKAAKGFEILLSHPSLHINEDFMNLISSYKEEELQKLLISILKKDPNNRKTHEIKFMESQLRDLRFFQEIRLKISFDLYMELFKEMRFELHNKDDVIFKYGDVGKKMYIILKGSVYILVPKLKISKQEENVIKNLDKLTESGFLYEIKENAQPKIELQRSKTKVFKECEHTEEEILLEKYPNYRIANKLKSGELFGEISISLKEPRTATVICTEETTFCILKSHGYEKILKASYEQDLNFLQKIWLFRDLSVANLAILKGYFIEKEFIKNHIIYKEGSLDNNLYIIKSGEVEFFKKVALKTQANINLVQGISKTMSALSINNVTNTPIRRISFGKAIEGQIFGEEEVFTNINRKYTAVVSSSKTKIFILEKQYFFNNLKSLKIIDSIQNEILNKQKKSNKIIGRIKEKFEDTNEKKNNVENLKEIFQSKNQKERLMSSLSLKHMRNHIKDEINNFPLTSRILKEPKEKNIIEISPILKMCAVSTSMNKFERKKNQSPNAKILASAFENELIQKIEFLIEKKNQKSIHKKKENYK